MLIISAIVSLLKTTVKFQNKSSQNIESTQVLYLVAHIGNIIPTYYDNIIKFLIISVTITATQMDGSEFVTIFKNQFWILKLAEVSDEFGFGCLSFWNAKSQKRIIRFFLYFLHEIRELLSKKITSPISFKKVLMGQEGTKNTKKDLKMLEVLRKI